MTDPRRADTGRQRRPDSVRGMLWPWSTKSAILLVPAILLTLLIVNALSRAAVEWPEQRHSGWVLLGILLLSLLPLLLVFVQLLADLGASIQLPGVSLSFAAASQRAASAVRTTTLTENLGTEDVPAVAQTSLHSVLRALRKAHDSEVTVIDLRQGRTWWETRLFILVAGAARRDRPQAIAFVGDRNGRSGAFLGWAPPSRLLDMHLAAVATLAEAYESAQAKAMQWQIGTPAPQNAGSSPHVTLPWNNAPLYLPPLLDEAPDPAFAFELFLQQHLDQRPSEPHRYVTAQRLDELYEPVLVTDRLDVDSDDRAWAQLLAATPRRFFALTTADTFKALVPRDALLGTLVARVVAE